ncbi:MAG: GntR family transcriptional regulator [Hyphomicrobiaceae bacterium]
MAKAPTTRPDARPLYEQVRLILIERIQSGHWPPAAALPSEFELAAELGVSQGTVRKALDGLAEAGIVVRRQGRGTFVVEHTPQHVLFRFFSIYDETGEQVLPDSLPASVRTGAASAAERAKLGLDKGAEVIRIRRIRTRRGAPFIHETIVLPAALFPDLGKTDVPNTLYDLFQKVYGVLVAHTDERITAVAASPVDSKALDVAAGAPLLHIDRVTFDIEHRPVEWRRSTCNLRDAHYLSRLR